MRDLATERVGLGSARLLKLSAGFRLGFGVDFGCIWILSFSRILLGFELIWLGFGLFWAWISHFR